MVKSVQMFRDEAVIFVAAGNGGDGCSAFHREKYISRGGPSGGDGGNGGDVVLVADANENSLYRINREYHLRAAHGVQGSSNNRSGANGASLYVKVPVGTQIFDFKHGNCLADLCKDGQSLVVASGGKGGRGNARFASAIRQTPRYSEEGRPGESRKLRLELKLVADVGLLGLPNAGKSTLMNTITSSKSKVADYPFTTLDPSLGIVDMKDFGSPLVLADIPGLISGAASGKGLGLQFLRHIERTKVLLHLVDCSSLSLEEPSVAYRALRSELGIHSPELAQKQSLVVATKVEDEESRERAKIFFNEIGKDYLCISSATYDGLDRLKILLRELVNSLN